LKKAGRRRIIFFYTPSSSPKRLKVQNLIFESIL